MQIYIMPRLTFSTSDEVHAAIESRVEGGEASSKSEAVHQLVCRGLEADDLERELEHAKARVDELRQQLQARGQLETDVQELKTYVQNDEPAPPFIVRWWQWYRTRN